MVFSEKKVARSYLWIYQHINKVEGVQAINILRSGDDASLGALYKQNRTQFFAWFRKQHGLDEERSSSLYQKAFIVLFENVRNGKLSQLESTLGTYLIGIGKNLLKSQRNSTWEMRVEKMGIQSERFDAVVEIEDTPPEVDRLTEELSKMGEKCRSILILYYYQNFSMEAIAHRLGYKNEAVAKKSKYECLQKLKQKYREA